MAYLALVLASAVFLLRGPLRARSDYVNDFAAPYVSSRLWFHHLNPYDPNLFFPEWRAASADVGSDVGNPSNWHSVYPPPTLLVLLPFTLLPWPAANTALVALSVAVYLTALLQLTTLLPGTWRDPRKPLFLAAGLALAPAQSALHVSNVACLSAGLLFLAVQRLPAKPRDPDLIAAGYIALSICLKPTLGLLIIPWLVLRHWRTLAETLATCSLIAGISLYPLHKLGSAWLTSLRENLIFGSTNGGTSDVSPLNPNRFDRIDLQLPIYAFTHIRTAASLLAGLIAAALLIAWFAAQRKHRFNEQIDSQLLAVSTILIIGLLPVYQRYYMAILLVPTILWAFRNLSTRTARWLLTLCALFLVNTEALLRIAHLDEAIRGRFPTITEAILGPHLCWLIFTLACILLVTLYKQPSASSA